MPMMFLFAWRLVEDGPQLGISGVVCGVLLSQVIVQKGVVLLSAPWFGLWGLLRSERCHRGNGGLTWSTTV